MSFLAPNEQRAFCTQINKTNVVEKRHEMENIPEIFLHLSEFNCKFWNGIELRFK